jgi:predicted TIM-barrel fold metal-dependent hydrolase
MQDLEQLGIRLRNQPARRLYDQISQLEVIDAHEHLFSERHRVSLPPDAAAMFAQQYPAMGLLASGMPPADLEAVGNLEKPLDERWALLRPHLLNIRDLALTRALMLGIRELYGFDEVDDGNYIDLTEAMRSFNRPGIYREIFRDRCRIAAAFVQQYNSVDPPWEMPPAGSFRLPQMFENLFNVAWRSDALPRVETCAGRSIRTLDAFMDALEPAMAHFQRRGLLGIKLMKQVIGPEPAREQVAPLFEPLIAEGMGRTRSPALVAGERAALRDFIGHAMLRICGELGLRVMFHSGTRPGIDFRSTDPNLHVPLFAKYPDVNFEIYHCGMPWVRDAGMIAMSFPNVWLNMCWTQSISPRMARSALCEWLEYVPHNKIIACGGDSAYWIEHSVGDLIHSRVNLAMVLADRVEAGETTEDGAVALARRLLFDNAADLHRLNRRDLEGLDYN